MTSIRKRLLLLIFGIFLLFTIAVSITIYFGSKEEVGEIYDENMKQIALVISGSLSAIEDIDSLLPQLANEKASDNQNIRLHKIINDEEDFVVQIWKDERLRYSSHLMIDLPLQGRLGFSNHYHYDEPWHIYTYAKNGIIYQIAQTDDAREEIAMEVSGQFFIPLLILIPFMFALLYLFIGQGLKPLTQLSSNITSRNEYNLNSLEDTQVPEEVRPLVQALNSLLARLDTALHKQRQFVADAAHELCTPLTAVQLQLDTLERAGTKEERDAAQNKLKSGVNRSINLVKSLLLLARNEPESLHVINDVVDLVSVAKTVFEGIHPLATEKRIQLELHIAPATLVIQGQKAALVTLLENLVENAILYTNENGSVRIELERDEEHAIFTVSDDGIGIKKDERERVFDRFYRVLGTKQSGSGLGLSIVKNIVDYYRGTITIEDGLEGKGCSFVVSIPLANNK